MIEELPANTQKSRYYYDFLDAIAIISYGIFFPKQLYRKIAFPASKAEILWEQIYRSCPPRDTSISF
jgi:hypothetical protein